MATNPPALPHLPPFRIPEHRNLTPAQALDAIGGESVSMSFPIDALLTIGPGQAVFYPRGTNIVPTALSTHWYLAAAGATVV